MSQQIIDKAMRDSAKDHYDPPHNFPGGGWLNDHTAKQLAEKKLYQEVWRTNRENILKQRK